jgi:C1A family cysteine protease
MFINEIDAGRVVMASIYAYSNLTPQVLVTGIWPPPGRSPIGGHAICLIGYVRGLTYESSVFTFFNSWGSYTGSFNQTGDGNIVSGGIPGLYCISFSYVANSKYSGDWWSL